MSIATGLRHQAQAAGLKRYQGTSCKYGHNAERLTSNSTCVVCLNQQKARSYQANPNPAKARTQAWSARHPKWRKSNRERWKRENPKKVIEMNARRRAAQLRAAPKWVNRNDLKIIYANCPTGYQVDHIIPLQNRNVCGLHVPWNLQYLSADENRMKHNTFDGTSTHTRNA